MGRKLYYTRHGESLWNVENKICGATDIALTEFGHEQAIETGKKILEEGIKVYASQYVDQQTVSDIAQRISLEADRIESAINKLALKNLIVLSIGVNVNEVSF